eukprot:Nk52_evm12s267 gene=Nk52_evmTU12s267
MFGLGPGQGARMDGTPVANCLKGCYSFDSQSELTGMAWKYSVVDTSGGNFYSAFEEEELNIALKIRYGAFSGKMSYSNKESIEKVKSSFDRSIVIRATYAPAESMTEGITNPKLTDEALSIYTTSGLDALRHRCGDDFVYQWQRGASVFIEVSNHAESESQNEMARSAFSATAKYVTLSASVMLTKLKEIQSKSSQLEFNINTVYFGFAPGAITMPTNLDEVETLIQTLGEKIDPAHLGPIKLIQHPYDYLVPHSTEMELYDAVRSHLRLLGEYNDVISRNIEDVNRVCMFRSDFIELKDEEYNYICSTYLNKAFTELDKIMTQAKKCMKDITTCKLGDLQLEPLPELVLPRRKGCAKHLQTVTDPDVCGGYKTVYEETTLKVPGSCEQPECGVLSYKEGVDQQCGDDYSVLHPITLILPFFSDLPETSPYYDSEKIFTGHCSLEKFREYWKSKNFPERPARGFVWEELELGGFMDKIAKIKYCKFEVGQYKKCGLAKFGVAQYKTCQHASCGMVEVPGVPGPLKAVEVPKQCEVMVPVDPDMTLDKCEDLEFQQMQRRIVYIAECPLTDPKAVSAEAHTLKQQGKYSESLQKYIRAAECGYTGAMYAAGLMYYEGHPGIEINYYSSFYWWSMASLEPNALDTAMYSLAVLHSQGKGTQQDPKMAFRWFERSATKGNGAAQLWAGSWLVQGISTAKDCQKGKEYITQAGHNGQKSGADAMMKSMYKYCPETGEDFRLRGHMFLDAENREAAKDAFKTGGGKGCAECALYAGFLCRQDGEYVDSVKWYNEASTLGHSHADYELGKWHMSGEPGAGSVIAKNEQLGIEYWNRAMKDPKHAIVRHALGRYYLDHGNTAAGKSLLEEAVALKYQPAIDEYNTRFPPPVEELCYIRITIQSTENNHQGVGRMEGVDVSFKLGSPSRFVDADSQAKTYSHCHHNNGNCTPNQSNRPGGQQQLITFPGENILRFQMSRGHNERWSGREFFQIPVKVRKNRGTKLGPMTAVGSFSTTSSYVEFSFVFEVVASHASNEIQWGAHTTSGTHVTSKRFDFTTAVLTKSG